MNIEDKSTHCIAPDRNNKQCRNYNLQDSRFCTFHQYMNEYTEDMMKSLTQCSTCLHHFYIPGFKTCEKDRKRGENIREKKKEEIILCKYYNEKDKKQCTFKKSDKNDYCGKHQLYYKTLEIEKDGTKKVCINFGKRYKCESVLDKNDKYSKCEKCRDIDCKKEKERNINKLEKEKLIILDDMQLCKYCPKYYPQNQFIGINGNPVVSCPECREKQKDRDIKRSNRKRDWKNELDRNPERKTKKQKWRDDNPDKVVGYYRKYRGNQINELGVDEYHRKNAEQAKKWRNEHADKVIEINNIKRLNPNEKYKYYKRRAENLGLEFDIDIDEFLKLIEKMCHYCGTKKDLWNGIDRKNNDIGYTLNNIVPCCYMCNMLKNTVGYTTFFNIISHIISKFLLVIKLEDYKIYPNAFRNYNSSDYKSYKYRANKKNYQFELTLENFNNIRNNPCYICNKYNNNEHQNGIDRINNNIGYIIGNCLSCCANCNYMKNSYTIYEVINKLYQIWSYTNGKKQFYNTDIINTIVDIKLFKEFNRINNMNEYTVITNDINNKLFKREPISINNKKNIRKKEKIKLTKNKSYMSNYKVKRKITFNMLKDLTQLEESDFPEKDDVSVYNETNGMVIIYKKKDLLFARQNQLNKIKPIEKELIKKESNKSDKLNIIDNKQYNNEIIIIDNSEEECVDNIRNKRHENKLSNEERKKRFLDKKELNKQILKEKYTEKNNKKRSYELGLEKAKKLGNDELIEKYKLLLSIL
jgi:hypothetical protein